MIVGKVKITSEPRELSRKEMVTVAQTAKEKIDELCQTHVSLLQAKDFYEQVIDLCQDSVEQIEKEIGE